MCCLQVLSLSLDPVTVDLLQPSCLAPRTVLVEVPGLPLLLLPVLMVGVSLAVSAAPSAVTPASS